MIPNISKLKVSIYTHDPNHLQAQSLNLHRMIPNLQI